VRLEVQLPWLLSMLAKSKGFGGEAGEAHVGEAGQALDYARLRGKPGDERLAFGSRSTSPTPAQR
jgi:hypothetical protein